MYIAKLREAVILSFIQNNDEIIKSWTVRLCLV